MRFWRKIAELESAGGLDAGIRAALQARGYVGASTAGAPDLEATRQLLKGFEAAAAGGFSGGFTQGGLTSSSNVDAWAHSLPPDFRRAAGEIYRNIRSAGTTSVRQWLQEYHTGSKHGAEWQHLWAMATTVDFAVGGIASDMELYQRLNTDDQLELALRHLSAHVHEQRTKDYVGGAKLRAMAAPEVQSILHQAG